MGPKHGVAWNNGKVRRYFPPDVIPHTPGDTWELSHGPVITQKLSKKLKDIPKTAVTKERMSKAHTGVPRPDTGPAISAGKKAAFLKKPYPKPTGELLEKRRQWLALAQQRLKEKKNGKENN